MELSLCPITGQGLDCLARTKVLRLYLGETDIDDSHLEQLKSLNVTSLDIQETKVSKEGCEAIQANRPKLKLLWSPKR